MNAIDWLNENAPGFAELSAEERTAIMQFSLLWSLFESSALKTNGNARTIVELTAYWAKQDGLGKDSFAETLAFFQKRYVDDGNFTYHFDHLHFRGRDKRELVESVLTGKNENPADIASAVLIIVLRYRNNYLHGIKWAYSFKDQLDNFKVANDTLMKALELYNKLGCSP